MLSSLHENDLINMEGGEKMRLSEVKERTGLGKRALQYLYDNVLHVEEKKIKKAHRVFI